MNLEEKVAQLALQKISGIGNTNSKALISYSGSASSIFKKSKKDLLKIPGIGPKTVESILKKDTFSEAESILKSCEKLGIHILHYTDSLYPSSLKLLEDAPAILYVLGDSNSQFGAKVAIVGTRKATTYGKQTTQKICEDLVLINATVISGLAYGIDIEAHKKSLSLGLKNIAVLAGGLDSIYPPTHTKTAKEILEKGGWLLSEQPPSTNPEAHYFPARNRIIAGMADTTIVVEAADTGGALITANIAYTYEKPVFAVPGNLGQKYSEGCNQLIATQKANIYTGIKDICSHLGWEIGQNAQGTTLIDTIFALDGEEKIIANFLQNHPTGIQIDELAWKSQVQINKLAGVLLQLEFKGIVKSLPGKKYKISN